MPAVKSTRDPNALFKLGDHCRFCPAKVHCPAQQHEIATIPVDADPSTMTGEELGAMLLRFEVILASKKMFDAEAFKRAMNGDKVLHHKLVRQKANRVLRETLPRANEDGEPIIGEDGNMVVDKCEAAAVAEFGEKAYAPRVLLTAPNLEKLPAGKAFVQKWAYTPDTGLTLAKESDKRPEVKRTMVEFMEQQDGAREAALNAAMEPVI